MKKYLLILIGFLLSLIIGEIILRLASFCYSPLTSNRQITVSDFSQRQLRIACVGDSWTYGLGQAQEQSYPAQLEMILNKSLGEKKVIVYNFGYPDFTSTMAVTKLKEMFPLTKPHLVIVMIGRSDRWNPVTIEPVHRFGPGLTVFFQNLKIVKLLRIVMANISIDLSREHVIQKLLPDGGVYRVRIDYEHSEEYTQSLEQSRNEKVAGKYVQAVKLLEKILRDNPVNLSIYAELDDIFIRWNNPSWRVLFYEELLQEFPGNQHIALRLSQSYKYLADILFQQKQYDQVIILYQQAMRLDPDNRDLLANSIYNQSIMRRDNSALTKEDAAPRHVFSLGEQKERVLVKNLQKILVFCRAQKSKVIFSSYPLEVLSKVRDISWAYYIPFIDHTPGFARLLKQEPISKYFIADGHCNALGYRIVAERIADTVLEMLSEKVISY